jgi:Methyltransferase domain
MQRARRPRLRPLRSRLLCAVLSVCGILGVRYLLASRHAWHADMCNTGKGKHLLECKFFLDWQSQTEATYPGSSFGRIKMCPPEQAGSADFRSQFYQRVMTEERCLSRKGIEVGALHHPAPLPPYCLTARRFVDKWPTNQLRVFYPELSADNLVEVDILDDADKLATVADGSQDFLVASHLLEHMEGPIAVVERWLQVLRPGGVLLLMVPDKVSSTADFSFACL